MQTQDYINLVIATGTLFTAIATIILAFVTKATVQQAKKNSRADFLLRLDVAFLDHVGVREKLADGGIGTEEQKVLSFPKT